MTRGSVDQTHETVREHYAEVARTEGSCGCGPGCCSGQGRSTDLGYSEGQLAGLPKGADMGLGCGTPLAFAALRPGETVLDLGSGGGIDCFLAASQVGPTGKSHRRGHDGRDDSQGARRTRSKVSATNVEFRLGEIENLPVPDRSVDVIVSNCVINLSPDKDAVFRDAFRVLKPGGRLAISDIVTSAPMPEAVRNDPAALAGCIAGAPAIEELRAHLLGAGFSDVVIEVNEASRSFIKGWNPGSGAEDFVAAAAVRAIRPSGDGCCGTTTKSSCC